MTDAPGPRSVKIPEDERGAWSSDRPRRNAGPPRPTDISTRCRLLRPADRMRYSPGSLLVVVSPVLAEGERFAQRVLEETGPLLSAGKVRELIRGRVPDEQIEAQTAALLDATVAKRLQAGDTVVVVAETLDAAERERWVRPAAAARRPRHLILIDVPRDDVPEEVRPELNELRRALDAGELGQEGIQTVMRLGGSSITELKRIVFRPPPKDD
ncbi:MAG: hypothetical protein MUC84_08040 [Solirubrobacteraceae bacterium]|jgi:hypothetical protein|nr:hypothetical protein [Solirubrobacteraceae bacterium]MCU0313993.1 hypothetical protein [Solirubrobacteraceae bacterium]